VNVICSPSLAAPRSLIFTRDASTGALPVRAARFRTMTVAHKTIAGVRKLEVLHRLEKGLRAAARLRVWEMRRRDAFASDAHLSGHP
jgi:hypothetical protein